MFPWGHAAVAYVLFSGVSRHRDRRLTGLGTVVVLIASQLPDIVDKPLAFTVPLLPNGRTLAHSLVTGSLLLGALVAILIVLGARGVVLPLAIGYLSHLFADALNPLLHGDVEVLAFLGWPIFPALQYDGPGTIVGHFVGIDLADPFNVFQFLLVALALLLWIADGRPGLIAIRTWISDRFTPV